MLFIDVFQSVECGIIENLEKEASFLSISLYNKGKNTRNTLKHMSYVLNILVFTKYVRWE